MFGLALHGSAVSSRSRRPRDRSVIALDEAGVVSVPLPAVSGYVSRRRASCSEGGTSPGGPRGPPTDFASRLGALAWKINMSARLSNRFQGLPAAFALNSHNQILLYS